MKRLIAIILISTAFAPSCAVQATQPPTISVVNYQTTALPTTTTTTTTTTTLPLAPATNSKRCNKATVAKLAEYGLPADPFAYIAYRESPGYAVGLRRVRVNQFRPTEFIHPIRRPMLWRGGYDKNI